MTPPQLRPRVEGAREEEILDATVRLLLSAGYDRLTLDAVAKEARASKATLYRRWDGKASLVVDAMVRAKQAPQVEVHDTGTLRGDLLATFCGRHGLGTGDASGLLGAVMTAVSNDPDFAERFRSAFIAPKVEASLRIYRRATERGEIDAALDLDVVAPSLAGIVLHRAFVLGLPVDDDVVRRVIDHVILPAVGLGAPAPGTPGPTPGTTVTARTTTHSQEATS
ncbi:TetR/AcrR family transcriptional regulator [Nocardioides aurantiacus]|uniref:TetR family transcriptional regulator n=1 Tax=Nocardioides aurantiacus TaxID=86796 RepID=A0A3N2CQX7_9ACTN|nr:TetR/AcrR family transcriptional regulator [Nocardioides aurantiacus]ROR89935.1 TetR family transcriptional regulator [Nocardioides aurantiacus]